MIDSYTPEQLAVVSTILTRVTASRGWTSIGTASNGVVQEEVQAMRIGHRLLIACNGRGADAISDLFQRYHMGTNGFEKAMRSFYYIISSSTALAQDYAVDNRLVFSQQEQTTLTMAALDLYHIRDWVHDRLGPNPSKSSAQGEVLRNLAGERFTSKFGLGAAPSTCRYTSGTIGGGLYLVAETTAKAHAEMKILTVLVEMLAEGTITTATKVQLGGLKAACKKCAKVLTAFNGMTNNMVQLPGGDTRPSATPQNWALPALQARNGRGITHGGLNIAPTLWTNWANTWAKY